MKSALPVALVFLLFGCSDDVIVDRFDVEESLPDSGTRDVSTAPEDVGETADGGPAEEDSGTPPVTEEPDVVLSDAEPRQPDYFLECQPDIDIHPPETPWRLDGPTEPTLEEAWRADRLPQYDEAMPFEQLDLAGALSLGQHDGRPAVFSSTHAVLDGTEMLWHSATEPSTGLSLGGPSTLFYSGMAKPLYAGSAIRDQDAYAHVIMNRLLGEENSLHVSWDNRISTFQFPTTSFAIRQQILAPGGMTVASSTGDIFGLDPRGFTDTGVHQLLWSVSVETLWGPGADQVVIASAIAPRRDEVLVHLRENIGTAGKIVRVDRCGNVEELASGPTLGAPLLWTGDGYLVTALDSMERPRLGVLRENEVVFSNFICSDAVENRTNVWSCVTSDKGRFQVVEFGPDLNELARHELPEVPEHRLEEAFVTVAGQGGTVIVGGFAKPSESGPGDTRVFVALVGPDDSRAIVFNNLPGNGQPNGARGGVLGPNGNYVFHTGFAMVSVQTHLLGLANTRFPRARYGGNENRGFVD